MKAKENPEPGLLSSADVQQFRRSLMRWYRVQARVLPWRGVRDAYRTWVSEVMLQQTRVAAVLDHYDRFLRLFPTVVALALAPEDAVLAAWSGLGYYRRARMLHKAAHYVATDLAGSLPSSASALRALPGIGEYTCAAIASIAFGESIAVVDGNVERVLLRITGRQEEATAAGRTFVRTQAAALVPERRFTDSANAAGDHNQAMMELGATICLPRAPLCLNCPVHALCRTRGEHPTAPRARQRSQRIAYLLMTRKPKGMTEVLFERRDAQAGLMPGMLELPALPVDAVDSYEPMLRLRHSITTTNYYVEIYGDRRLQTQIPARAEALAWMPADRLHQLPLTGLARKVLKRLDLMAAGGMHTPMRDAAS